ncbi:hypothetical protein [Cupriavidus sp. YAF13]|uniref:hypothetical protein n=1 Tax=Cupriavidus sp. YAF13 TaxID=3233075 RepID=UPI003F8F2CC2
MKPAFTKGPWRATPFVYDGVCCHMEVRCPATPDNSKGLLLAHVSYASKPAHLICYVESEAQATANARAMAAAPDLLTVAVEVDSLLTKQKWLVDGPDPESQLLAAARAAIAKATGEQQ